MRLLLVTHYYADHRGGIEIVANSLAEHLPVGIMIAWAASGPAPIDLPSGIRAVPMRAWNGCETRWGIPFPLWSPGSLRRLWNEVESADIVHVHESHYFGNTVAALAAVRFRRPFVVTQHVGFIPYRNPLLRATLRVVNHTVARWVMGHAGEVVFISDRVRTYFLKIINARRPARLIPNGVDPIRFYRPRPEERRSLRNRFGWRPDEFHLVFVGRFVEKKGLHLLRSLAARFRECKWTLIGRGPLDPTKWQLPNVACLGPLPQSEVTAYLQAADLLVLPSVGEGFPLVVQEAMACGTPALVSDETARGLPGIEGLVYSCPPELGPLTELLRRLLRDRAALELRGKESADYARSEWCWDRCAATYAEMFRNLSAGQPRPSQPADSRVPAAPLSDDTRLATAGT